MQRLFGTDGVTCTKLLTMKNALLLFLFASPALHCSAQTDTAKQSGIPVRLHIAPQQDSVHTFPRRLWLDASWQFAYGADRLALGIGGNLHYLNSHRRHFEVSYNYVEELAILSPPEYAFSDIAYKIGWLRARKYVLMEFAVGLSCVTGYNRGDEKPGYFWSAEYKAHYFTTVGLCFEADAKVMARRYFGLGLVVKGNLNPQVSYIGYGIEITLNGPN